PRDDMWSQPDFSVQEPDRPKPSLDEFIVEVTTATPRERGSPSIRFRNIVRDLKNSYRVEISHGLLKVVPSKDAATVDDYADLSDSNGQVSLECTNPGPNVPNPLCAGYLYFSDLRLELTIVFPADALPKWREIRDGVRTLLDRWAVQG